MGSSDFLPYGRQLIEEDDIAVVTAALRSEWLTTGPQVEGFEADLAAVTGAAHAVACSSGTAALHMALAALGVGAGDCAIVPAITFLATANAAIYLGAEVEFADVDPDTGLMTPQHAEAAVQRAQARGLRPAVLIPVHLAGQVCDMAGIRRVADACGARIVEDACHALGGTAGPAGGERPVGACHLSDLACFSFHPVKTVAMGEGGAVTTNDAALAEAARRFRSHGMMRDPAGFESPELAFDRSGAPNPWYYEMPSPGMNYRASDLNCALGRSQLKKLGRFVEARRSLVGRYDQALAGLDPIRPLGRVPDCRPAWHLYVALIDFAALDVSRAEAMAALRSRGIGAQVHYLPVAWQPFFRARNPSVALPGAARYYERTLSLPLFPSMQPQDVDRVVDALKSLTARAR